MPSQNNEESYVLAACAGIPAGRFLDIGAWAAECFSNVRGLYERGWSGVLVEPSPGPFAGLQKAYADDPRVVCIQAAVGFERKPLTMWVTEDCTSTSDPATYEKWKGLVNYTGQATVEQILLEDIYEKHGPFDMVSIDAEGTSTDLMHRLFELGHRPKCICVEYDDRMPEVVGASTRLGYAVVYSSGENLVLVKQ